jgi:hypothetical protein
MHMARCVSGWTTISVTMRPRVAWPGIGTGRQREPQSRRGPHQLGAFDAYTIAAFGEPVAAAIPDDPALADGTYARLVEARERLAHAETEADLRAVLALTPGDPSVLLRLAVSLEGLGREAEALAVYRAARAAEPAFREERDAADAAIARLEQAPNPR